MSNQIKFKRTLFGISKKPVVEYVESISKSVEDKLFKKDSEIAKLKKDIDALNAEKAALQKEINDFEEEKNKISDVFLKAEETAKNTVSEAERKSELIMKDTENKVRESFEKMRQEQQRISAEFDIKINAKQSELNSYKSEINFLREKIKLTLNKFDEILENSTK